MHSIFRCLSLVLVVCLILPGCSSSGENTKPLKLEDFDEEVRLRREWRVNVGNGQGDKYYRLKPVINRDMIYAASNNGRVVAVERETGRRVWRERLRDTVVSGGVGFGDGMLFLGTEDARLLALDAEDGSVIWETNSTSEVLSTPSYGRGIVVVQTVDGKLQGMDAETGEQRWIYESTVPALSLRGTSSPIINNGFVIAGMGNGSVVSVALDNGTLRWEQRVAIPTGRSEIERLVDIDGELLLADSGVLVVPSYQGYMAALDVNSGQIRWRVEASTSHGAGEGFGNVYISTSGGRVEAYRVGQEDSVWENEALLRRDLSAPIGFSNYVVVADYKGYLHLLSQVDGSVVGRTRSDKKGVRSHMLTRGGTLYVYGNSGKLSAYRVR